MRNWALAAFLFFSLGCVSVSGPSSQEVLSMNVSAPFGYGEKIPVKYTCDGEDVPPEIVVSEIPESARSLLMVMYDPDAPAGTWIHWVLYNIPVSGSKVVISESGGHPSGLNSWGRTGYGGPCPPGGTHRYFIKVLALDVDSISPHSLDYESVMASAESHAVASAETMGVYSRE